MTDSVYHPATRELAQRRKELAPEIHEAFERFSHAVFAEGALPEKTKQLIAVAVAHVTQCPYCIAGHTQLARRKGASPEEVMEAVWVAAEMRAGGAFAHSTLALHTMQEMEDASDGPSRDADHRLAMPGADAAALPAGVLAQAVAQAPDAVVIVDAAGEVRYWNKGAERIFGYQAHEMLGSTLDPIIPERLRQRHTEGFRAAIARGSSRYGDDDLLAVPAHHADGRMISIEFSVALVTADDGSVAYVSAIMRDVTARRAQEQELRQRLEAHEPSQPTP